MKKQYLKCVPVLQVAPEEALGSFIVSVRTEEDAVNYFYCHLSFIFAVYIIVEPLVHSED